MWFYIVFPAFVAVVYDIVTYNALIFLRQKARESLSGIDVQLKRRHDLIPKLVLVVKHYTAYEQEIFERAASERAQYSDVKKLFALSESYPELKADKNFAQLHETITETEDQIAASRKIYNETVQLFNSKLESFPALLVGKIHDFRKLNLFLEK